MNTFFKKNLNTSLTLKHRSIAHKMKITIKNVKKERKELKRT